MQLFYTEDIDERGGFLPEAEARHCLRALRLRTGDRMQITDGNGRLYTAVLLDSSDRNCPFSVEKIEDMPPAFPFYLHLAVAPTKNADRMEWFVEKAVEIGISEITCLQCEHSERSGLKAERMQRLMVAAMKQSLHFRLPVFNEHRSFKDFMQLQQHAGGQKFIAYCGEDGDIRPLKHACRPGGEVVILIGPEGDFSPEEIRLAKQCGFLPVSMGRSRLRTETAALVACHTVHLINE